MPNNNIGLSTINGASTWQKGHIVLGAHHLWIDGLGKLRIKNGGPTGDQDGFVVGPQT